MQTVYTPPLVSIITPSYNQGKFIDQTIKSVRLQDYPYIEHIIIDGGSCDETLSILEGYSDSLFWVSERDNGQSDAINKGFSIAKGDIVCWLNSDDTYEAGAVSHAVDYLLKHHDVMMIYGEGNEIDEKGHLIKRFPATQKFDLWTLINIWDYILQPTTFFRKSIFNTLNPLDVSLRWCMDWDLWIRIGVKFKVSYVNYLFANTRIYPETKTNSGGLNRFREIATVMRKYGRRRYPLGYFIFLEDTVENLFSLKHPRLYKILRRQFTWLRCHFDKKRLTYQGVYQDGWLAKKAYFMLPCFDKSVKVKWEMEFPVRSDLYPNKLEILVEGKKIREFFIQHAGKFVAEVEWEPLLQRSYEVELRFAKAFVPKGEKRTMVCFLYEMTTS